MSEINIWDESKFAPEKGFFKWGSDDVATLYVEKPITAYKAVMMSGDYGQAPYLRIKMLVNNEVNEYYFKISSVRLRKALMGLKVKKPFPYLIRIYRMGTGFETKYSAEAVDVEEKDIE